MLPTGGSVRPFRSGVPALDDDRQPGLVSSGRHPRPRLRPQRARRSASSCVLLAPPPPSLSLNLYAIAQMFAGPRAAGTWVGFQNSMGNLSGIVMPIVTGILVQHAGYDSAFVLTAAVGLLGAVWWRSSSPPSVRSTSTRAE